MYILIFDDGTIKKSLTFTNEDEMSIGNGLNDVIDISDYDNPKWFYDTDDWRNLESADE